MSNPIDELPAPFSDLYEALIERIKEKVPEIKWIDLDYGQLENYEAGYRPPVNFPCLLLDFDEWTFDDAGDRKQMGMGVVVARLALAPYSHTSASTNKPEREIGKRYIRLEQKLYTCLHGWDNGQFQSLRRASSRKENRRDDLRVRALRFSTAFEDISAQPIRQKIQRPDPTIKTNIN